MSGEAGHYKLEIPSGYHDSPIPTFPTRWKSMFSLTKFNGIAWTHTWFTIATVINCIFTLLIIGVSLAGGVFVLGVLWLFFFFPITQIVIRVAGELIISVLAMPHMLSATAQAAGEPSKTKKHDDTA
jgi:hypothetical protein